MSTASAAAYHTHGRVNQKRRTRAAVLAAAWELLAAGQTPSVREAADRAGVSRTTAYRYFASQELLLIEASLQAATPSAEQLFPPAAQDASVVARVDAVVQGMHRLVSEHEAAMRTFLRLVLEQGAGPVAGEDGWSRLRSGRRLIFLEEALAPLRPRLPDPRYQQLRSALALVMGVEAYTVLRDVCRLSPEAVLAVMRWAAATLVQAVEAETEPAVP
jgi:AcrR family transcriptional regulator